MLATRADAMNRATSTAIASPKKPPLPIRPQNTITIPAMASRMVNQVRSGKIWRIRTSAMIAAIKGMAARITRVLATIVWVMEMTKHMLLPVNSRAQNKPSLKRSRRA